jgi:pimeloyl-ACP methyl ester carboxylesterase
VRSLVLICTTPGGPHAARAADDVLNAMVQGGEDPSTIYRRNAWFLYGADTRANHPERIEEDLVYRGKIPTTPAGYFGQLQAAMSHDTWDELPSISSPTLVLHGDADLLVPTENGKLLAQRIPGAELVLVPGAGHMLQSDGGDAVRDAVLGFLAAVCRRGPTGL